MKEIMCENFEEKMVGMLKNDIPAIERMELEKHLENCAGCREELAGMQQIWGMLDTIETPEPSAHMRVKFEAMLDTYKESVNDKKQNSWDAVKSRFSHLWNWQPRWSLAYSLLIVLLGFGAGYWVFNSSKGDKQGEQLKALSAQVHELKQTMMLALLENPSASERIKGVSYTSEIKHADKEVINALLATLNNDPNVNVRLTTLDALSHLANHPEVRQGLIQSILQQDSPLMQSAIADVMLKLQEKKSVKPFRELLKQKDLNPGVRDKIKQTITQLI